MVQKADPFRKRPFGCVPDRAFESRQFDDVKCDVLCEVDFRVSRVLENKLEMEIRMFGKLLVVQKMDSDHRLELVVILSRIQLFHVELAQ